MVLVLDYGISKECNTVLRNFQGWSFVLPDISKGKVTNLKILGVFSKICLQFNPPCLDFFWNSSFKLSFLMQWIQIKLFNYLKATKLPHCFTASSGMLMVAVKSRNVSFFFVIFSATKTTDLRSFIWPY